MCEPHGEIFEKICRQYMLQKAKAEKLPFIPHMIGKWWGNNPKKHSQDDVDILLMDRKRTSAVFCECKFRSVLFDKSEFEDLMSASEIFSQVENRYYYLFSGSGFSQWGIDAAGANPNIRLVSPDDLFEI